MDGISLGKLLLIALLIVLLFGTKKLGTLGSDLGNALKGFKKAMNDDADKPKEAVASASAATISEKVESQPVVDATKEAAPAQQERV